MIALPNICFIGQAGAGKTMAAELLVKNLGYERLSFARPLKIMLGTETDRERMQEFGTDVVREYEPDAWVNLFIDSYKMRGGGITNKPFCVDDCRFPNEATRLRGEGFVIVRIVAPRNLRVSRLRANGKLGDESQLEHSSERALDDFPHDYRIVNDGWPSDLEIDLGEILSREQR